MKTIATAFTIAGLSLGMAFAQGSAGYHFGSVGPDAKHNTICLWTYLIDHTTTVDPSTIVFHMRGGTMWKNTLRQPCPGLKFHGFTFLTQDEYVCSNMQAISVISTHESCKLGAFTPYAPPQRKVPAQNPM